MREEGKLEGKLEGKWIAWLRGAGDLQEGEAEYLPVRGRNGFLQHGGNQNWWMEGRKAQTPREEGGPSKYQECRRDERYRLANCGCGVIAMINLEMYLERQKERSLKASDEDQKTKLDSYITREQYEKIAFERWQKCYYIDKSYLNYVAGLYPWKMERGLKEFLQEREFDRKKVKWAPYLLHSNEKQSELVLETIQEMLLHDYPVIFSYHTYDPKKDRMILYSSLEKAAAGGPASGPDETVNSHYMTILGVWRCEGGEILLRVESWGRIYYVRYDVFAKKLGFASNILRIW